MNEYFVVEIFWGE